MTTAFQSGLAAALALGALALAAPAASAMPMGLAPAATQTQIDPVRWVCGPYRCHWRPDYWRHHRHHGWRHW
jgi:Spy/CpxP family protein refolding chaperone